MLYDAAIHRGTAMTSRILFAAAAALFATPAFAATTQSTAQGFDAQFVDAGIATHAGPFTRAVGQGSGPYNNAATAATENEVIALAPQNPTPSLYINLGAVKSQATSTGILLDSESWGGKAAVDKIAVALNLNPLPPGGVMHPLPFLQITAHDVKASAGMAIVFPSTRSASGSAKIGSLDILGSALGFAIVHYSGTPAPNTVVYDTATVTITLNKQIEAGVISCGPTCVFTVTSIETEAVDIDLHKAPWHGHKITGDIVIGRATAK
jgi:hypothetical protein